MQDSNYANIMLASYACLLGPRARAVLARLHHAAARPSVRAAALCKVVRVSNDKVRVPLHKRRVAPTTDFPRPVVQPLQTSGRSLYLGELRMVAHALDPHHSVMDQGAATLCAAS